MNKLVISGSPHTHDEASVKRIMLDVIIAMSPMIGASLFFFGYGALRVLLVSVLSCVIVEYLIQKYLLKVKPTINDYSAVVTGILLAFNVPSNLPTLIVIIGAIVSIGIGKMTFGGLGKNIFNPALVGRVVLLISFPVQMTTWPKPIESAKQLTDVITGPTPLGILKEGIKQGQDVSQILASGKIPDYEAMFWGFMGGSMGEVSALLLILGGIYMLYRRVITWHIPVSFILSAFIFAWILHLINPAIYIDPFFHMVTGGLMLGAIFMATDMVTSPMSKTGQIVFGIGCGLLTILIRVFGAYPEGVSFAILIMNAFTPLINIGFKPKKFGGQ